MKRYTYETGIRCTRAWFAERGFIEYRDALGRVAFLLRELYDRAVANGQIKNGKAI